MCQQQHPFSGTLSGLLQFSYCCSHDSILCWISYPMKTLKYKKLGGCFNQAFILSNESIQNNAFQTIGSFQPGAWSFNHIFFVLFLPKGPDIYGPILFNLSSESPSSISAAWRPPAETIEIRNIIDYSVCYINMNNGNKQCTTAKPRSPDAPVQLELKDLIEDTPYEVFVRARNATGYGPPSNVMNVKTREIGKWFVCFMLKKGEISLVIFDFRP